MGKFILILLNIYAVFGLSQRFVDKELERYEIFQYNLQHVMKQKKMLRPYTVGITQFSDLTHQEFKDLYLGYKNPSRYHMTRETITEDFEKNKIELPESVD